MKKQTLPPVYLLAGGNPGSRRRGADPLMSAILRRIGIPAPTVGYVGAASGDNPGFFEKIAGWLRQAGAGDVILAPTVSEKNSAPSACRILETADVVFMSSGDVDKGMNVLNRSGMTGFLGSLHRQGKPFVGVSAGSIMLGVQWIRWPDENNESFTELFHCLGCVPVICDTHAETDGWEELKSLLIAAGKGARGYGIPSGGCLVAHPDGTLQALGSIIGEFTNNGNRIRKTKELHPSTNE